MAPEAGGGANGGGARELFSERRPRWFSELEKTVVAPRQSPSILVNLQKSCLEFLSIYKILDSFTNQDPVEL